MVGNQSVIWTSPYETRPKVNSEVDAYLNVIKKSGNTLVPDCFDFLILLKLLESIFPVIVYLIISIFPKT